MQFSGSPTVYVPVDTYLSSFRFLGVRSDIFLDELMLPIQSRPEGLIYLQMFLNQIENKCTI